MKTNPPHPHRLLHEQAAPTAIHHYDQDQTALARLVRRGVERGIRFWLVILGALALVVAALVLWAGTSGAPTAAQRAWTEYMLAEGAEGKQKVAGDAPGSPAAHWALIQAAEARYIEGLSDLSTGNRDAAGPLLNQAYNWYKTVAEQAPADSFAKRLAATGMARTLEARGELDEAIQHFRSVAKAWPDSPEGKEAAKRADELKTPTAAQFYKDLYAFKPRELGLPAGGSMRLPPDHPPIPPLSDLPPVIPPADAEPPAADAKAEIPSDPFAAPAPKR